MTSDRQDLTPPDVVGRVQDTPSRRLVAELLHTPRRTLIRLSIEDDGPAGWRPHRWITLPVALVPEVVSLLKRAEIRANGARREEAIPHAR